MRKYIHSKNHKSDTYSVIISIICIASLFHTKDIYDYL